MHRTQLPATHSQLRRARPGRRALALLAAASVVLAACGGDDDDDDGAGSAPAGSEAPATQPDDDTAATTTAGTAPHASQPTNAGTAPDAPQPTNAEGDGNGDGEQPVDGGTLTYLAPFPSPGFDPALAVSATHTPVSITNFAVYDQLVMIGTATKEAELRMLEAAESDDGQTWTLTLKPDIVFSDGSPLDAEAIKYNWERLADPATEAIAATAAQAIASITVVDDLTLDVELAQANGQFLSTIATTPLSWIGSPTAIEADPAGFNANPVGAGAFTLTEWVPNDHMVFAKNPTYWGEVHLDEVTIREVPDEAQRMATLQSGDGDASMTVSGVTAQTVIDDFDLTATAPNLGFTLFFNVTRAPFDDVRARQAFALVMDGQELSDTVYGGFRQPVDNLFLESSPFYSEAGAIPASDNAAAQALFDELAEENGGPLQVSLSYVSAFTAEAEWFLTKLAGFSNVEVTLDPVDSTEFQQRYTSGDVQFGIHSYGIDDPDGLTLYVGTGSGNNYSLYSDPDMDDLLQQGRAAQDQEDRTAIYDQIQQKIIDEVIFVPFLRQESWKISMPGVVHGNSVEHMQGTNGGFMLNELWVTR